MKVFRVAIVIFLLLALLPTLLLLISVWSCFSRRPRFFNRLTVWDLNLRKSDAARFLAPRLLGFVVTLLFLAWAVYEYGWAGVGDSATLLTFVATFFMAGMGISHLANSSKGAVVPVGSKSPPGWGVDGASGIFSGMGFTGAFVALSVLFINILTGRGGLGVEAASESVSIRDGIAQGGFELVAQVLLLVEVLILLGSCVYLWFLGVVGKRFVLAAILVSIGLLYLAEPAMSAQWLAFAVVPSLAASMLIIRSC